MVIALNISIMGIFLTVAKMYNVIFLDEKNIGYLIMHFFNNVFNITIANYSLHKIMYFQ